MKGEKRGRKSEKEGREEDSYRVEGREVRQSEKGKEAGRQSFKDTPSKFASQSKLWRRSQQRKGAANSVPLDTRLVIMLVGLHVTLPRSPSLALSGLPSYSLLSVFRFPFHYILFNVNNFI